MKLVRSVLLSTVALLLTHGDARADLLPEGMVYVPVKLTLDGQEAFGDATIVVQNCAKDPRHSFTIAKAGEALDCRTVKRPLDVRAVPKKDLKPLEDLYAQNKGWAYELKEADGLLAKAPACGKAEVSGLVERAKNIDHVAAKYALAKAGAGCSLKKIEVTNVSKDAVTASASAPSGSASASASASGSGSASASASGSASAPASASAAPATASVTATATTPSAAPSSAPAPQKSGCATAPGSSTGGVAWLAGAFALAWLARRRQR